MTSIRQDIATRGQQQQKQTGSLAQLIHEMTPQIRLALPKTMDAERVARIALTAVRNNPKLAQCNPQSFMAALMNASVLGLEINTPADEAYLYPFGQEATLVVGYKGWVKMFWQHPLAEDIDSGAVYPEDDFDYARGTDPFLRHRPALVRDRKSEPIAYWASARLKGGATPFVVLSPDDARELRQGKVGPDARFKGGDPMRWMERKTALRQLLKILPKSTELTIALAADEKTGTEIRAEILPQAQAMTGRQIKAPQQVDYETGEIVDDFDPTVEPGFAS